MMNVEVPRLARAGVAAAIASLFTCAQLAVVAWMNHAEPPPRPASRVVPLPILAPPRRKAPLPDPEPSARLAQPSLQAPTPEPLAVVEPSAVSSLAEVHAPADHIAVLPALSAGNLGRLGVGSMPEEGEDRPARPLRRPRPSYPASAKRRNIEGFVDVRMRVDAQGRVVDVVVVKGQPAGVFDTSAVQAARRYRFEPATRGGEPVADTVEQRMVFRQVR